MHYENPDIKHTYTRTQTYTKSSQTPIDTQVLTCREDLTRHWLQKARARNLCFIHLFPYRPFWQAVVAALNGCSTMMAEHKSEGLTPEEVVRLRQLLARGYKKVLCVAHEINKMLVECID
jgi:hypothetical protein